MRIHSDKIQTIIDHLTENGLFDTAEKNLNHDESSMNAICFVEHRYETREGAFDLGCVTAQEWVGSAEVRSGMVTLGQQLEVVHSVLTPHVDSIHDEIFETHASWDFEFVPAVAECIATLFPYVDSNNVYTAMLSFLNPTSQMMARAYLEVLPENFADKILSSLQLADSEAGA